MEWIIIAVIAFVILAAFADKGKCDICGLSIKRTSHTWRIGGKKQKLCPKCNNQMERRVSKNEFKKKFG